ncbi:uncharacterized protein [Miscanthus floridulus]|uniref:uncharacterized protein n=1 Tax=Miscanthus floridulus TaxID=154761 RepID=UPI0034589AE4
MTAAPMKTIRIAEVLWVPSDNSCSAKEETHHCYLKNSAEPPLYGEGRPGWGQGTVAGLLLLSVGTAGPGVGSAAKGRCEARATWGWGPEGVGGGAGVGAGHRGAAWGTAARAGVARPGCVGRGGMGGGTWGVEARAGATWGAVAGAATGVAAAALARVRGGRGR